MLRTLAVLIVLLPAVALADMTGQASVVDGDTIEIHGTRIRLHGIDAPESGQLCYIGGRRWQCGKDAALVLADLIDRQPVTCQERDRDRYGRIVAVCRVAGEDLGAWLVTNGLALAYRRYSTAYVPHEDRARAAKALIWQSAFVPPWDWRRGKRLTRPTISPTPAPQAQPACCKICRKGQPCGNSCISRKYTCRKPPGCACAG